MVWSCLKSKSNYLSCYGKSPLPQGCQNSSIIEQQQLWCSAWLTKALAVEILPRWCLHSREPCTIWQILSGAIAPQAAFAGCFLAAAILSIYVSSDFWENKKKKKFPTQFPHKCQDFFVCMLFLWSLRELEFKLISLSVPRNMMIDAQCPQGLHHFRNPFDFQNTDINRVKQTTLWPRKDPRISLFRKNTTFTHLSQTCCKYY